MAPLYPFGPLFAFFLCSVVIIGQNYQAFVGGQIDWSGLLITYIGIPLFLAFYIGYKVKHKTKLVPLEHCDLTVEK